MASTAVDIEGRGGPNGQIVSVKRAAGGRRQRSQKIIDEEREKYRAKNGSLRNTSTDSKGATFVILINHASAPIGKKRLSSKSSETQEVSEIGRKESEESRGFPILWTGIMEDVFQMERKEYEDQERLKM